MASQGKSGKRLWFILGIVLVLGGVWLYYKTLPLPEDILLAELAENMVLIKGGKYQMGCADPAHPCDEDEVPVHTVSLDDFYMSKYEVTRAQWYYVMYDVISDTLSHPDLPISGVSWIEAQQFIKDLNLLMGTNKYRLPTEAEWEYAARGGATPDGTIYAGSNKPDDCAWFSQDDADQQDAMAQPVGKKKPNGLGLYDMSGNVNEWCQDVYALYMKRSQKNPLNRKHGTARVYRGGSYLVNEHYSRVTCRGSQEPSVKYDPAFKDADYDPSSIYVDIGLRVVLDR